MFTHLIGRFFRPGVPCPKCRAFKSALRPCGKCNRMASGGKAWPAPK